MDQVSHQRDHSRQPYKRYAYTWDANSKKVKVLNEQRNTALSSTIMADTGLVSRLLGLRILCNTLDLVPWSILVLLIDKHCYVPNISVYNSSFALSRYWTAARNFTRKGCVLSNWQIIRLSQFILGTLGTYYMTILSHTSEFKNVIFPQTQDCIKNAIRTYHTENTITILESY